MGNEKSTWQPNLLGDLSMLGLSELCRVSGQIHEFELTRPIRSEFDNYIMDYILNKYIYIFQISNSLNMELKMMHPF